VVVVVGIVHGEINSFPVIRMRFFYKICNVLANFWRFPLDKNNSKCYI
jgi:hypothetical protein